MMFLVRLNSYESIGKIIEIEDTENGQSEMLSPLTIHASYIPQIQRTITMKSE